MIQLNQALALDSTTLWILSIPLILVIAVHVYLRQLIRNKSGANQFTAQVPA